MTKHILISSIIAASLILFNGCTSKVIAPKNSGFFQNYEDLKQSPGFIGDTKKLSQYKKVYVDEILVIPAIPLKEQTQQQKDLYKKISKYATDSLKGALKGKNTNTLTDDALILKAALSTSEVHFEDKNWNNLSPLSLGITVVSLNAYIDGSVRLVGEYRLDAKDELLARSLNQVKNIPISIDGDFLTLNDLEKPIDQWVATVASELDKRIK